MRKPSYFEPISNSTSGSPPSRTHFGIDLGTGATCIYPLLFCASSVEIEDHDVSGDWKWLASEVDPTSTQMALQNVLANRLTSKIQVVQVQPTGTHTRNNNGQDHDPNSDTMMDGHDSSKTNKIPPSSGPVAPGPILQLFEALPVESRPTGLVDVIMTNPPFHEPESPHTTQPVRSGDERARTSLTSSEASYPGGEVQFIVDIIIDSLQLLPHPSQSQQRETSKPTLTALWYSSMFGKKTSWVQVNRILAYMLGPARIQSTEFGPGHLTRWFLAWTFCRPNNRSPVAAYCPKTGSTNANPPQQGFLLSFNVTLEDNGEISRGVIPAVLDRVVNCFTTFPGLSLTAQVAQGNMVSVRETTPHIEEWDSNLLPPAILEVLHSRQISFMDLLPQEGHFVVDAAVSASSTTVATVQLKAYAHSQHGRKAIDKIASHVQTDICRTSRRWRRQLQRQQAANQAENHHEPMES